MFKNILLLLFVCFFMFLSRKTEDVKLKKIFYIISLFVLIVCSGFREYLLDNEYVGTDYNSYVEIFNTTNKISSIINIGFNISIMILKLFRIKYIGLFVFLSFFTIIFTSNYIRKNVKYYELAFLIFISFGMLFVSYNIARQWIAAAIFLYGFEYIKKKNFKKYFLCIAIASSFHISAAILILLYFVLNNNLRVKYRLVISSVSALILGNKYLINWFLKLTIFIDPGYYYRYVTNLDKYNDSCNYVIFFVSLFFLMLILINFEKYKKLYLNNNVEINYLLLLVTIAFLGPQHIFYHRMFPYFLPALLIVVPNTVDLFKEKYRKIYYCFIILLFFVSFL